MESLKRITTEDNLVFEEYITAGNISAKVKSMAEAIKIDFAGKNPLLICVLKGSFLFFADLVKYLPEDIEVEFLRISSYSGGMQTSGQVNILSEIPVTVAGRNVIVVEDIVDSGLSVIKILEILEHRKPLSISFASLLIKKDIKNFDVKIDYIGFRIPDKFVIGYGLDYKQRYRNLDSIYVLSE